VTGLLPPDGVPYNYDQWDGYTADRRELLTHLHDRRVQDTVFLTGDIHSTWACDVPVDAGTYPASPSVATELVCTSVTSDNLDEITGSPPRPPRSRGVRHPGGEPARAVPRVRQPRLLGARRAPRAGPDGLVLHLDRTDPRATSRFASAFTVRSGTQSVTPALSPIR
jgi:alkaline phosphatase D